VLTVIGKSLGGRRKLLFEDFCVPPPNNLEDGGKLKLRDLIEMIVIHEVEQFKTRQHRRQFIRALTAGEIETGAENGKIDAGQSEIPIKDVETDVAIATALTAFEDGLFLVVVDDKEYRNLDSEVILRSNSRLTFIRLTMLAGG
jgi:hypothetical protein